jgi:hypothetical protein
MAPYEQKTDSKEFEVADPAQCAAPPGSDSGADVSDIAIRLWSSQESAGRVPLTWATDSVLVYMIADLVCASSGRIAEESPEIMAAHFGASRQAVVAARRIQTSILEFLACRPGERVAGAILIYQPRAHFATGFSDDMVRRALGQAKPGQILLAENISQRLRELPGIEVRDVPAVASAPGGERTGLKELVWTTPDRVALLQTSAGEEVEPRTAEFPPLGATVIVHSPVARPADQAVPPAPVKGESISKSDLKDVSKEASPITQRRGPASKEFPEGADSSSALSLEEFVAPPLFTRTRMIFGVVALVLVAALVSVLNRPAHVSKRPIPVQQDQAAATDLPEKQAPAKIEPEASTPQPESKAVKTEIVKPPIVKPSINRFTSKLAAAQQQVPDKTSVDYRGKKDVPETPASYNDESGGVSQKDIPALLKMAQGDAGAGNYDKARTEFRKILGLQPGNPDAKEGLHKLDIIQKDRQ